MGWTGMYPPFHGDKKKWILEQIECDNEHGTWKVTDLSFKSNVAYGILEYTNKTESITKHIGMVILCGFRKDEWAYKEMSEDMEPNYYDAPKRLIDKLDSLGEPLNEYSRKWREQCRAKASVKKPKLKFGDVVKFAHPMSFSFPTGRVEEDTFTYVEYGTKKNVFKTRQGNLCRISKLTNREFTVLSN